MESLIQDVRYGFRMLLRRPGFAAVAVFTLALGIGANTAIFSLVNAALLRPLPFAEPDRLALIKESLPKLGWLDLSVSAAEFLDYRDGNRVFEEIAGFTDQSLNLTGQGEPERVQAARVSASLFSLLGVQPQRGRAFSTDEDRLGNERVVIFSHGLWQRHFGSDPNIVGKVVRLDDKPFTVVGVMPPRFQFPYAWTTFSKPAELWIPLALTDQEKKIRGSDFQYGVIGRLKPGVAIEQAQADIESVAARVHEQYPEIYSDVQVTARVINVKDDAVKKVNTFLWILLGAVALVLLIACANLANLLLARAVTRRKEMAIRSALGASSLRIGRQLLTESILLALFGGALGLLVAAWAMDLLVRFGPRDVPRLSEVTLDWKVLGFTLLVSILTGILFGLAPILQSSRLNLNEILKDAGGRASSSGGAGRLHNMLVVFETASALVLLIGAALLINSFIRLLRVPPGFEPEGVVIAQTALPAARYQKSAQLKTAQRQMLDRLGALPGVQAVGVTTNLPLVGDRGIGFAIEGDPAETVNTAYNAWVSNDYFRALGIQMRSGRSFTDDDRDDTQPVVVVNETMQRRYWPEGDVLGKRIKWGGWGDTWLTIVGIVSDVKVSTLEAEIKSAIYMPMFQMPRARSNVIYVVRSSGDAAGVIAAIRREIRAVDAELPVYDIRTMNQVIADSVSERRFTMLLLFSFAAAALLLAGIGLYGVMSYAVTERTREIGIRMALGAARRDVLMLVVGRGMSLAFLGVALGLGAACALTRVMKTLLFEISATDPLTFTGLAVVLATVAFVACWIPARRATAMDPMMVLRYE